MVSKRVLRPERRRRPPTQFSWIDQRLVRDRHIERCNAHACALYLFLVTVADAQGLSYYSDSAIARRLSMDEAQVRQARQDLLRAGLIAYEPPLYQVLALDPPQPQQQRPSADPRRRAEGSLRSIRELLRTTPGDSP